MLREIMEVMDLLDDARVDGQRVKDWLLKAGCQEVQVTRVEGAKGATDFVKVWIRSPQKTGPTLGIVGRLGGIGARPEALGLVSDADGCIIALASAARLARMAGRGDVLPGDVIVATHVCPNAPTVPHQPTRFMGTPVEMAVMNRYEVDPGMEAILSVDTTKGNWVLNRRGFAITPTVKEGYILRVSDKLLEIMKYVTGDLPVVLAITTQDITPYENGFYHLNSIMQPAVATSAPVVGVATTSAVPVPGCATGVNQVVDMEAAGRFCVEVAKAFTANACPFYDQDEYGRILSRYGSLRHLQT